MRGGLRVGQGRKPRALLDKLPDNPGKRPLKVMDLPEGADLPGEDMPEPKAYMKEKQRNGGKLEAEEIYRGNLAVAEGPALRKAGEPPAH